MPDFGPVAFAQIYRHHRILRRILNTADDRMVAIEDADEAGLRELSATYRAEIVDEDPVG